MYHITFSTISVVKVLTGGGGPGGGGGAGEERGVVIQRVAPFNE